jgi:hypothetical protein
MKRYHIAIIFLGLLALGFVLAINPEPKKITKKFFPEIELDINTPAFRKSKGFTNYQELISFLNELQTAHSDVMTITYIGESQKGKAIPLVTLNKGEAKGKVRVWLQGGLHGDEMASTEGVLYMLDRLLNDKSYRYMLDKLEIRLVPMANIDGYEKENRYAANGLDLNRDQTKLNITESRSLKQAFSDFNAEVAVDFHEYRPYRKDYTKLSTFGVTSRYDAMFMYSGNLNVPENVRKYTKDKFVTDAELVLQEAGIKYRDYLTTSKVLGDIHFNEGSNNARSSATSYALSNCISSLIEIRGVALGRTSFKRRINAAFLIGMSYLKSAYDNGPEVKQVLAEGAQWKSDAVVRCTKKIEQQSITFIDIETCEEIALDAIVHNASASIATLSRVRPAAYILEKEQTELVQKLKVLGLNVQKMSADRELEVESYSVIDYQKEGEKYEGIYRQKVSTQVRKETRTISAGSYIIYLDQENASLAIEVLEPEAPNSFVSFHVLETSLGDKLPLYRYLKIEKI